MQNTTLSSPITFISSWMKFGKHCAFGLKLCAKVFGAQVFFLFSSQEFVPFSKILFNKRLYLSLSLGVVSVQFLHTLALLTKTNTVRKVSTIFLANMCFFCWNILKFGNLPTVFIHFHELLPVTHWFNGFLPCLSSRPKLKVIMPKNFGCRKFLVVEKVAEIFEKTVFSELKWYFFVLFWAHAHWIVYQCLLIDETTKIVCFFAEKILYFFRLRFGETFFGFWRKSWHRQENFFKRIYLRAYKTNR